MGERIVLDASRPEPAALDRAVGLIGSGGVILYPTDTIYGLGCNAFSSPSIKRIFEIKGRAEKNPVIILAENRLMLLSLVREIPPPARRLMDAFWPGPLTLIFNGRSELDPLITGDGGTVAIRVPASKFCLSLMSRARVPIVSTSANLSGAPPVRDVRALAEAFGAAVDLFVDAGTLPISAPSTIVDVSGELPRIVREGAVAAEKIAGLIKGG